MTDSPYAEPIRGLKSTDGAYYHRIDLPELRDRDGWQWDLIGDEGDYLGGIDLQGKRVLEFGAANGALSFYMEKQGAEVVACDLSPNVDETSWDVLIREGMNEADVRDAMSKGVTRLNNGFWYVHEQMNSNVKLVHGTAYKIPDVGRFDVVTLCAILLHLRDPLGAIEHAMTQTDDYLLITDLVPFHLRPEEVGRPLAVFLPSGDRAPPHGGVTWWHIAPELYRRFLDLKGFDVVSESNRDYRFRTGEKAMFHIVARKRR